MDKTYKGTKPNYEPCLLLLPTDTKGSKELSMGFNCYDIHPIQESFGGFDMIQIETADQQSQSIKGYKGS